ncbi:LysR substrate-binding domain-containing protein [Nocardioides insulae]|uniref:LysR substrate-binding domain-containing protein n=1 Tax=Nocardioides insulae TaxID=394734 RepID=UPI0004037D39|nr:LysR substrate-binding domain-containing protein [Nocardioides insulae]
MELRHLRYFVAVAEELHFGRAAARLHMAQPPLSQAIRQLEAELGVELLRRSTRRVELTEAGTRYLDRAHGILGRIDAAGEEARRYASGHAGHLTLGCVGSATYSLLPALARALREELPGLEVTFRGEMLVPELVTALENHEIDLAIMRPPVDVSRINLRTVRRDRLIVVLPEGHRLTRRTVLRIQDLRAEDLVMHSGGSVMNDLVLQLIRTAGFVPRIRHEVGETSTLVTFVAAGLGIAVAPDTVAELGVSGATYRPLLPEGLGVDLVAGTRAGDESPQVVRALEVLRRLVRR